MCHTSLTSAKEEQRPPPGPRRDLSPRGDSPLLIAVGIAAVLVAIGAAIDEPGILILVLILATPALIRAMRVSDTRSREGGGFLLDFVGSLGVIVLIGLATAASFYITCAAVCLGGVWISELSKQRSGGFLEALFLPAMVLSVGVAFFVAFKTTRWLWRRK